MHHDRVIDARESKAFDPDWQLRRDMPADEFRVFMHALKLSRNEIARYIGVSQRQGYRYDHGEVEIPTSAVLLLRAVLAYNITPTIPPWRLGQY
jgi:transcriptional regulator with XRE-family HTH domain